MCAPQAEKENPARTAALASSLMLAVGIGGFCVVGPGTPVSQRMAAHNLSLRPAHNQRVLSAKRSLRPAPVSIFQRAEYATQDAADYLQGVKIDALTTAGLGTPPRRGL